MLSSPPPPHSRTENEGGYGTAIYASHVAGGVVHVLVRHIGCHVIDSVVQTQTLAGWGWGGGSEIG